MNATPNPAIRRLSFRAGVIVFAAMMVLALSLASSRRDTDRAAAIGIAAETVAAAEQNGTGQTSTADGTTAARTAKEIRGASPYMEVKSEPPARLIVDPPLPDLLDQGIVYIQWRAENVHIVPVVGNGAINVSPRVGHLHVHVDDLPWLWADASDINTIDLAGMPPGPHKIRVDLVNANHEVFPGQTKTVTFTVGKGASPHSHSR